MRYLITVLIGMMTFSCVKEEIVPDVPPAEYFGNVDISKNDKEWDVSIGAYELESDKTKFNIYINHLNSAGFIIGNLILYKIPKREGIYQIEKTSITNDDDSIGALYTYYIEDGHVLLGSWDVEENPEMDNYVEVTSFNENTGEISGHFHLEMTLDSNLVDSRLESTNEQPRTVFSNVDFFTKLLN